MSFYINVSKCTQILDGENKSFPIFVHPGFIVRNSQVAFDLEQIKSFKKFDIEGIKTAPVVTFVRKYALGDLMQLIPVVRLFQKTNPKTKIYLSTVDRFLPVIRRVFPDVECLPESLIASDLSGKYGIKIYLDSVLERDHSVTNPERLLHRMHIYENFLKIKNGQLCEYDWSYKMGKNFKPMFNPEEIVIGFQIRGSGKMKTLPIELIKKIVKKISSKYKVFLIDQDSNFGWNDANIINATGKCSVISLIENMKYMKCVFTMDSGVLWMTHVAQCPVVTFLGPTREAERMSLHPLYPDGAQSIDLAEQVGCKPCFETKTGCKGAINCMNKLKYDTIVKIALDKLEDVLKKTNK